MKNRNNTGAPIILLGAIIFVLGIGIGNVLKIPLIIGISFIAGIIIMLIGISDTKILKFLQ